MNDREAMASFGITMIFTFIMIVIYGVLNVK